MITHPKVTVTVGVVTNRPFTRRWCEWNVAKQTYRPYEVEVILVAQGFDFRESFFCDSMSDYASLASLASLDVIRAGDTLTCGALRNLVLERATGKYLCWFDDDDWQHPSKIEWMVEALANTDEPWVGWDRGWFWDLFEDRVVRIGGAGLRVANGAAMYRTEIARQVPYDNGRRASDGRWLVNLARKFKTRGHILTDDRVHSIWTRHDRNTSSGWRAGVSTSRRALAERVGAPAWEDSSVRYEALTAAFRAHPSHPR